MNLNFLVLTLAVIFGVLGFWVGGLILGSSEVGFVLLVNLPLLLMGGFKARNPSKK
jgi:hypothetical protein